MWEWEVGRTHLKCARRRMAVFPQSADTSRLLFTSPTGGGGRRPDGVVRQGVGCEAWAVGGHEFRQIRAKQKAVVPAKRAFGTCEPVQTGVVSVAREGFGKQW